MPKICTKCKVDQPLSGFHRRESAKDGLESRCKACRRGSSLAWHRANSSKAAVRSRAWRIANPEKHAANCKAWQKANPARVAAHSRAWQKANLEKGVARARKWQRLNPGAVNALKAKRLAAKLQAIPRWASSEKIKEIYKLAAYHKKLTKEDVTVDHAVPLQSKFVCGLHCEANLQIVMGAYNSRKGSHYWPGMSR